MTVKPCNKQILNLLAEKSSAKQKVYQETQTLFKSFKDLLKEIANELNSNICNIDKKVVVEYRDKGEYEARILFSGDALVFQMHSNVFTFDKSHHIWKHSYIKDDNMRGFFGVIHVYNFLSDSFKYNRQADYGYLIGRIFINKERHFFMEGKREFSFLYNNLESDKLDEVCIRNIIEKSMIYAIDFDLTAPSFNEMGEVTVGQITQFGNSMNLSTRKKLGFKFSFEKNPPK